MPRSARSASASTNPPSVRCSPFAQTRARLNGHAADLGPGVCLTPPLSYMEFLNLWKDATLTLTDSGGLQEETTALGVPCVTLRENTERPCTISEGTNLLAGTERAAILKAADQALAMKAGGRVPRLWDGKSAERIAEHLAGVFGQ